MNQLSASATNAAATITLAALSVPSFGTSLGAANRIDGLTVSYSGSPTGGRVTIIDGAARTVADGVTGTNTALTSATAAFTAADVGASVTGSGIAALTKILTVTNATTVVLTLATTATASGVSITISPIVFDMDITAAGPITLPVKRTGTAGNAMSVTLAAGGSAVVGKVNINAISQV